LSLNPLVPVPIAGVEHRPVPELYSARAFQEGFDDAELKQVMDENIINKLQPDLLSFRSHGKLWQRAARFNGYSFRFDHRWREGGHGRAWIKSCFRFSGTYDMNGELTIIAEEKGIYIDQFS